MLEQLNLKFYNLQSLNINSHPDENGKTFEENALIKAQYYFKLSNMPLIADDSGFCIPALDDQPGILSARFAEPNKNYSKAFKKIKLLLQQKGIEQHRPPPGQRESQQNARQAKRQKWAVSCAICGK